MSLSQTAEVPSMEYERVRVVGSFEELIATRFGDGVNAVCWPRRLAGDFREIASLVEGQEGIATVDEEELRALVLSEAGAVAREVMLGDLEMLRAAGLLPVLDVVTGSVRELEPGELPTDVYSFHADSATVAADTWLCSYTGACTEGLRNEDAVARGEVPEMRARLLAEYGGADDAGFAEYLEENFHALHYVAREGARTYSFGLHNLWRIALEHPGAAVPPCIHRAPLTLPGMESRLLLLS